MPGFELVNAFYLNLCNIKTLLFYSHRSTVFLLAVDVIKLMVFD